MRARKLTIQAFGPFAKTESINFDDLGEQALFLINGPTGAGKSSILDAICFALYGQTTGKDREASHMRCDFSADDLITEITLTFSIGNTWYKVERQPTQDRPKAKGDGVTTQQTKALIYQLANANSEQEDQLLESKSATKTTAIIETITGLNVEQFRQVMVLPQGKFREFLMADSASREAIFSKLFQTHIYKRLEDNLKQRSAGIRKQVGDLQQRIKGILESADVHSETELSEQLQNLTQELKPALASKNTQQGLLLAAENTLQQAQGVELAFNQLAENEEQLSLLSKQTTIIDNDQKRLEHANNAALIQAIRQTLQQQQTQLKQLQKDIETSTLQQEPLNQNVNNATATFNEAKLQADGVDKHKIKLSQLEQLLPQLKLLQENQKKQIIAEKQSKKTQSQLEQAQIMVGTSKQHIEQHQQKLNTIHQNLLGLGDLQLELDSLKRFGIMRAELDKAINNKQGIESELSNHRILLAQLATNIQQQTSVKQTLEFNWHSLQASLLAAQLQQDNPCPVCGSTEHPQPASSTENAVSKEDIETAESALLLLLEQQGPLHAQIASLDTQLQNLETEINKNKVSLGNYASLSTDALREKYKHTQQEVKTLQEQHTQQTQLTQELDKYKKSLIQAEQQLDAKRTEGQQITQQCQLLKQTLQQLEQQLPDAYRNPEALNRAIGEKQAIIQTTESQFQQAQTAFTLSQTQLKQSQATLSQQHRQQEQEQANTEQLQQQWQQALMERGFLAAGESVEGAEQLFNRSILSDDARAQLQDTIEQHRNQLNLLNSTIKQQKEQLKDKTLANLDDLITATKQQAEKNETALQIWSSCDKRIQQLQSIQNKLTKAKANTDELEQSYKIYGTLSDVANGQTGNKISLQRFVLSVLLDDVLIEASQRLQTMSKGRYQLLRKQDRAKGNKASGLELEVEDAYTGKNRAVSTLSGGESFMAALALALGLSDVVQAYAGGIKLDMLFIDEGFGSLDQESLDLAIRTLIDLQASGRMIGIISHVTELKEQMALRIDVSSHANSSVISTVC